MQRVQNYGSFLQAYGLKKTLEGLGNEVVFIDYKPDAPIVPYSRRERIKQIIHDIPVVAIANDYIKYYIFNKKEFVYEYRIKYLKQLGVGYRRNYKEKVDLAIIGSDEVFNCMQDGPNVGFSPALFGRNLNADRIISFAASFGYTTYEMLEQRGITYTIANWLKGFEKISVRDKNSYSIVKKLTGVAPAINLDPVLISDYTLPDVIIKDEKFAILYTYKSRQYSEYEKAVILRFCKNNQLRLVSIGNTQNWVERKLMLSPLEMLSYFSHANFVITDTFHGTVFSIKTKRRFTTIVRKDNNNKLADLLDQFELTNRRMYEINEMTLQEMYDQPIEYEKADRFIQDEKQKALEYLRTYTLS